MPKFINPKVEALNKALDDLIADPPAPDEVDQAQCVELLDKMDKLRPQIELPYRTAFKMSTTSPFLGAIYVAIGMGIFDALAMDNGSIKTADELHKHTKGDRSLLVRIMRVLICKNFVKEVGKETYQPLPLALICTSGSAAEARFLHYENHTQIAGHFREYFEKHDYKDPVDGWDTPAQLGLRTDEHFFDYIAKIPEKQQAFNKTMSAARTTPNEEWYDLFPVEEKLQAPPDSVVFVDIGGGVGADMLSFKSKYPELPGKMVLQDLKVVLDDIKEPLPENVEAQAVNFFETNPVKGAKCYYMRTVLHDWPDMQARKILQSVHESMSDDSILLVNESILQETNVPEGSALLDMAMLGLFSSKERTKADWCSLIESAGFKIKQVYVTSLHGVYGNTGLLECVKA